MVSGGQEKETFWFFYAILEKSHQQIPFDGLSGFFEEEFPLLMQYLSMFKDLFEEYIPELHSHFENEMLPDQLWIQKWFMSCFLYSFPMGLCIRIWDNLLAYGTRFLFNASLAILYLLKEQLLELDFSDINDFFKALKDDEHLDQKLLPPFEEIIEQAQQIDIPNERIKELFDKHRPAPKAPKV